MDNRLVRFTKWLLDAMFYGGLVITLGIPVIFRYVGRYIQSFRVHYIPQCVLYIGSGILALMIVRELRRMFGTVLEDNAFIMENADSLKREIQFFPGFSLPYPAAPCIHARNRGCYYCVFHCRSVLLCIVPGV